MKQEAMFNKVDLPLQPRPLELSFSKRPKPLPRDIEEWLHGQECLTIDEQTQWPIECCSTSMTQLDSPLQGECPTLFKVDGDGDKLLSLEAIREDLEKHSCKCCSCTGRIDDNSMRVIVRIKLLSRVPHAQN